MERLPRHPHGGAAVRERTNYQLMATCVRLGEVGRSTDRLDSGGKWRDAAGQPVDHDRWERGNHMLPNADGDLLVLARCQKHYAWQAQADMKAGIPATCVNRQCSGREFDGRGRTDGGGGWT